MVSVDPAITLSTNGSVQLARSAAANAVPNHLLRVDDLVKALLVGWAGARHPGAIGRTHFWKLLLHEAAAGSMDPS